MKNSIKEIINGLPTYINFSKVEVKKCTYINSTEEKSELIPVWGNAVASLMCGGKSFQFLVNDPFRGEVHFASFNVNAPFFYMNDSRGEAAQVNLGWGNEIQLVKPLQHPNAIDNNCKITLFSITTDQGGNLIMFLLLTPNSTDDYYFRIMFKE